MLTHSDIWRAIDGLAAKYDMSPSGLARRAGLDPTTFNKSKRVTAEGKQRWPSTESVAKILAATNASVAEFVSLMGNTEIKNAKRQIPLIAWSHIRMRNAFDDLGHPQGSDWEAMEFPGLDDPHAFGVEVDTDVFVPYYRRGCQLIASRRAQLRRDDRVLVMMHDGAVNVAELLRQSMRRIEIRKIGETNASQVLESYQIGWLARILWASQ